jgi:RNA-splicing ligase RtcB
MRAAINCALANRYIEENGVVAGALAGAVSEKAKTGQRQEMGTRGSGNHYLEVQKVITVRWPMKHPLLRSVFARARS